MKPSWSGGHKCYSIVQNINVCQISSTGLGKISKSHFIKDKGNDTPRYPST